MEALFLIVLGIIVSAVGGVVFDRAWLLKKFPPAKK